MDVIISKNVGNYYIFNSDSVCEDIYNKDEWINKILNSINKKIINNIEFSDFYLDL